MAQRDKLAVYTAEKVSSGELSARLRESFNAASIKPVTPASVRDGSAFKDARAFFLPGIVDEESPYYQQLGAEGNAQIRKFVEEGGIFVGACAGAYYACEEISYAPPWAPAKATRPGLDFFNALARGPLPAFGLQNDGADRFSDCTTVNVSFKTASGEMATAGIAYGNGPALLPYEKDDGDITVIARYEDVPGKPIAVATRKIGKGLAVFLGVLPFLKHEQVAPGIPALEHLYRLMDKLAPHEEGRKALWESVVSAIKAHPQPQPHPRPNP